MSATNFWVASARRRERARGVWGGRWVVVVAVVVVGGAEEVPFAVVVVVGSVVVECGGRGGGRPARVRAWAVTASGICGC